MAVFVSCYRVLITGYSLKLSDVFSIQGLQFVGFLPVSIGIFYSVKADEINVESAVDESLPESDSFFDIFQAEALEIGLEHYVLVRDLMHVLVPAQNLYLLLGESFLAHSGPPFPDGWQKKRHPAINFLYYYIVSSLDGVFCFLLSCPNYGV